MADEELRVVLRTEVPAFVGSTARGVPLVGGAVGGNRKGFSKHAVSPRRSSGYGNESEPQCIPTCMKTDTPDEVRRTSRIPNQFDESNASTLPKLMRKPAGIFGIVFVGAIAGGTLVHESVADIQNAVSQRTRLILAKRAREVRLKEGARRLAFLESAVVATTATLERTRGFLEAAERRAEAAEARLAEIGASREDMQAALAAASAKNAALERAKKELEEERKQVGLHASEMRELRESLRHKELLLAQYEEKVRRAQRRLEDTEARQEAERARLEKERTRLALEVQRSQDLLESILDTKMDEELSTEECAMKLEAAQKAAQAAIDELHVVKLQAESLGSPRFADLEPFDATEASKLEHELKDAAEKVAQLKAYLKARDDEALEVLRLKTELESRDERLAAMRAELAGAEHRHKAIRESGAGIPDKNASDASEDALSEVKTDLMADQMVSSSAIAAAADALAADPRTKSAGEPEALASDGGAATDPEGPRDGMAAVVEKGSADARSLARRSKAATRRTTKKRQSSNISSAVDDAILSAATESSSRDGLGAGEAAIRAAEEARLASAPANELSSAESNPADSTGSHEPRPDPAEMSQTRRKRGRPKGSRAKAKRGVSIGVTDESESELPDDVVAVAASGADARTNPRISPVLSKDAADGGADAVDRGSNATHESKQSAGPDDGDLRGDDVRRRND